MYPEWAPNGVKRAVELFHNQFFTNTAFFRCVDGFLTQFGIPDNKEDQHWLRKPILDDPHINYTIHKYQLSFAGNAPNSRSAQMFIAFEDLSFVGMVIFIKMYSFLF